MRTLLLAAAVLLLAWCDHPAAAQREVILGDAPRAGWTATATRNLSVRVNDGVLSARPNDGTRLFAAAVLRATNRAAVDARACSYLVFEINTLPGAGGVHRAPHLRVGLSDASGRTRLPLLSRFLHLDADPASWQQATIPLEHLLDHGVEAGAITSVTWQYAAAAAPFAVRRVVLVAGASETSPTDDRQANLLADPSFETRADARPVSPYVGDYRDLSEPAERTLRQRGGAADGRRYLAVQGGKACFFEALAPAADSVGFAVALRLPPDSRPGQPAEQPNRRTERPERGARLVVTANVPAETAEAARPAGPPEVEIGCEVVGFGRDGGVCVGGRAVRRVPLETAWRRHAVTGLVHLEDLPPDESDLRLYRGWVRPLSTNTALHLDAVHLCPAPLDAATFSTTRANPLAAGTGIFRQVRGLLGARFLNDERDRPTPPALQADLPPITVPLEGIEWAGRAWSNAIIAGGIPLPAGQLYSPDALRLLGPDGNDLPFQWEVLRRDPRDGSVRCLWVAFRAPLEPGQRLRCSLQSGATLPAQDLPVAAEAADEVLLNTGLLRARLSRQRFPLFEEADWFGEVVPGGEGGIRLELLDGRVLTSLGPPTHVTVERNGPLNAVILVRGFLTAADEAPAPRFRYEARVHAWRGVPGVQVNLAVTNLTPQPATPVRSLAVVAPLGRARSVEAALGREGGEPVKAALNRGEWLRLTQRRDPFRAGLPDLLVEGADMAPLATPGRAAGWATWQVPDRPAMVLAFNRMADRHPAALEVRPDSLVAYLLPPSGVKVYDFPFGMTAYAELWLGFGDAPAALDRLQRSPLLLPEPGYVGSTGVFPPTLPPEETRGRFPLLEWILGRELSLVLGDHDRAAASGWLHDGDTGAFGGWHHGEMDSLEALYLHFLRTRDPRVWERARRQALHLREVGTWWANETSAFLHPRGAAIHTHYRVDLASFWGTGLLYDYWLTGDARSLAVAEALSAELLSRAGTHLRGWERGRLLLHLAELYAATGRRVYREGMLRQFDMAGASETDLHAAGLGVAAAAEAARALGSSDLDARFHRALAALTAGIEASRPVRVVRGAEESYLYRGLSYAQPAFLSPPTWEAVLERLCWTFLAPHARGVSLIRAAEALPAIAAAGATLPAWASGTPLGIAPYAGQNRSFTLRIHRQGNEPVEVTLCRMRAAQPDPSRRYRVRFQLRDPMERVLAGELLEGGAFSAQPVALPRRGLNGDYLLRLSCEEDGLAEVLSAHPRVYLRADEWKAARHAGATARFYLRAPRRGTLRVRVRGTLAAHSGNLIAAALYPAEADAAGGPAVSQACWSLPVVGTDDDGRPAPRQFPGDGLSLAVPEAYRGRPLALVVTTPRSVEWRVEGLDEPWLAATAAAFP